MWRAQDTRSNGRLDKDPAGFAELFAATAERGSGAARLRFAEPRVEIERVEIEKRGRRERGEDGAHEAGAEGYRCGRAGESSVD